VRVAELAHHVRELCEHVAVGVVDAEQLGSCPTAIEIPRPNRKPVMTGLETRSVIPPRRSVPAATNTAAATSAAAAESAAKRPASPSASGPTVAADSAAVDVVAPTTSERDPPTSA
jgi:hypothetical protein